MTADNTDTIWKQTKNGGEWIRYEEVVTNPYFRERLKPIDGFKVIDGEYTLSVKAYENGSTIVYRNKGVSGSFQKHLGNRIVDRLNYPYNQEGKSSKIYSGNYDLQKIQQITGMKYLKLNEYYFQKDWEIFRLHPIVIIKDEPYVILINSNDNVKSNKGLEGIGRRSEEYENGFTNKEIHTEKETPSAGDLDD